MQIQTKRELLVLILIKILLTQIYQTQESGGLGKFSYFNPSVLIITTALAGGSTERSFTLFIVKGNYKAYKLMSLSWTITDNAAKKQAIYILQKILNKTKINNLQHFGHTCMHHKYPAQYKAHGPRSESIWGRGRMV